ncbi:MAG: hypothetical protein JNK60_19830 [Acidobacteria bacterium]|nr:hypothetical protein [Acidobacteriota bacterium]
MGRKGADAVVAMRLPSGAPDPSFGVAGILNLGPGGAGVTIQPDGKLLFGGSSSASGTDDFRVRRFEANGTPDTAFGVGGSATVDFEGGSDSLSGIALLADGSIVLAGTTIDAVTGDRDFVLARLTPGGTLDPAFGGAGTGRVRTAVTLNQNAVDVVRIGSRLTVVGNTSVPGGNDILLARYSLDGVLDTSYGLNGLFSVTFSATTDEIPAQASVSPDGRLVVAGLLREFSMFDFALIRTDAPCVNDFQVLATPSTCPSGDASATVIGTVPGATYAWTIQNGTILSGQGTPTIRYSAGPVGTTSVSATVSSGACEANGSASTFVDVSGCTAALGFHTLAPCRAVDTRLPDGPSAGPSLPARGSRRFPLAGICGVPADARAVAANVTVLNASTSGSLSAFAEGIPAPPTSVNAYRPGDARAAFAQLSLGENGAIRVESTQHTGSADVLVDVSGYYK